MNNMRRGFTMIELIFVIVIIGILAAVAIPKLAATRDDAKISNVIANTRTGLGDVTSFYTSKGGDYYENNATIDEVSNVVWQDSSCAEIDRTGNWYGGQYYLCDQTGGEACVEFDANDTQNITISINSTTGSVCDGVSKDPAIVAITSNGGTHKLGGSSVIR